MEMPGSVALEPVHIQLCDLPVFVLAQVLRHLAPADLARAELALLGSDAAGGGRRGGGGGEGGGEDVCEELGPSELGAWEALLEFAAPLIVAKTAESSGGVGVGRGNQVTRLPGESWKLCWATVCAVVAGADAGVRGKNTTVASASPSSSKRRASSSAAASIAPLPTPFTLQNPNPAHRRNAVWLLFGEVTDTRDANTEGTGTDAQRRERKKLLPATGDARWVAGAVRGYQRLLCRLAPEHLARATPRVAAAAKRLAKVGLWEAAAELLLAVFPAFEGSRAATATEDDDADPDTVERETPGSIAAVEAHVDVATFLVDRLYASTYVRSSERDTEDLVVAVLLSSDAVNVMQRVVGQSSRSPGAPGTASDGIGSSGGDGGDGGGSGVSTVGGPRVQSGAVAPTAGMLSAGGGDDLFGGGGGGAWILTPGDHPAAAAAVMPSGTAAAAATTLAATSRPLILPPQFSTPMARLGAALHAHARALALAAQHVGLGAMTLEAAARMPSPLLIWPLYHDPTSVRRTTVEGAAAMMAAALAPPVDGGGGGTEEAEGAAAADGGGAQGDDESDAEDAGDEGGTEQTGQSIPTAAATAATEIAAPAATVYRHRDMNLWSKRDHAAVRFSEAAAAAASARRIWERLRDRRREAAAVAVEAEVMYCEASALSASLHLQTADQQMGVLIINILQLCAPAIALFRKSVEILEGCGCGVTVEAATAMKDLGKTLGFVSRFLPVMPNHIASNLFGQRMPWDAGAEAGRWLTRAADIHAQLQGRRHPATKNARRLGGMEAEEDDTDEDDDGEANSEDAMDEENQLDGPDDATVGDYDNDAEDEDGEEDDDGEEDEINVDVAREEKQAEEAEVPAAAAVVGEDSGGERAVLYNDTSPANIAVASKLEHWRVS